MRTSTLFGAKNFQFFEIYDVFARIKGVKPIRTFFGQGKGLIFHNFMRTSLMDGHKLCAYKNFQNEIIYAQITFKVLYYSNDEFAVLYLE